ncbi:hypothetical protein Y032_0065g3686 [Ancylostoma ceylanicum]|uniref:Uncharacterized protein n=1 Tax=Ancylostoma ceylanicum TaxID=53326 RepID=A0A016U057_9BILA|nr:hypothetical protein Y032_0065g3686 [Ancylostoma ceylanicum]
MAEVRRKPQKKVNYYTMIDAWSYRYKGFPHVKRGGVWISCDIKARQNVSCPTFSSKSLESTISMFHINVDYELTLGNSRPIKRHLSSMLSSPR